MSASDNLSQELFFEAHRGVRLQGKEKTNTGEIGMHWSADKDKADEFATKHMHWPEWEHGETYHAQIPVSAVETGNARLGERGFANFSGTDPLGEKEVPVKEGATVKVTGVTKHRRTYNVKDQINSGTALKSRTRRFNPPREMKA
jgi:hypothetical protein